MGVWKIRIHVGQAFFIFLSFTTFFVYCWQLLGRGGMSANIALFILLGILYIGTVYVSNLFNEEVYIRELLYPYILISLFHLFISIVIVINILSEIINPPEYSGFMLLFSARVVFFRFCPPNCMYFRFLHNFPNR